MKLDGKRPVKGQVSRAVAKTILQLVKGGATKPYYTIEDAYPELRDPVKKRLAILKGIRARAGLTQVEFAKRIGVTQSDVSQMEKGIRPIGKEMAQRIAKAFKVDYRVLL